MSSLIGTIVSERRTQILYALHYHVLCTLFPLLHYLDDQCSGFLKLWLDYHGFRELPELIKHYTTIGNGTIVKGKYTNIGNHTVTKDIDYLVYHTQSNFSEDTPNQILCMLSTMILWLKNLYATIGQYSTLYDFLAIITKDLSPWEYYLVHPN